MVNAMKPAHAPRTTLLQLKSPGGADEAAEEDEPLNEEERTKAEEERKAEEEERLRKEKENFRIGLRPDKCVKMGDR